MTITEHKLTKLTPKNNSKGRLNNQILNVYNSE